MAAPRQGRMRWVPWAFVGFFAVVVAANGVMVALALWTFPGLVTENAYEKGIAYNAALARAREEAALGWRLEADYQAGAVTVRLADADGRPISDARIAVRLARPTREGLDRGGEASPLGQGRYEARLEAPLPGAWDLTVVAERAGARAHLVRRILIAP